MASLLSLGSVRASVHNEVGKIARLAGRFPPMRRLTFCLLTVAVFGIVGLVPARPADEPKAAQDPLADRVKKAIDRGVQFLRDKESGKGNWEIDVDAKLRGG